ncbi:MAG: peroxiredoxin, partial [Leeuwenhoekiella sp.]
VFVIYFYPKNFTPGCTKEACSFRDSYADFKALGADILGVSSDNTNSHARFADKYSLPFTMLSDPGGKIRKKFGVKSDLLGLIPGRETFIFDKQGKLVLRYNSLKAQSHITKAMEAVKNLNNEN